MKPTLKELHAWLAENERHLIGVYDQTGKNYLLNKVNNKSFISDYGGFYSYLETLYNDGITTIYIDQKKQRPDGNSIHSKTIAWEYHLKKLTNNTVSEAQDQSRITPGLNGGVFTGLSGQAYVDKIEAELTVEKKKRKKLKKQLKSYESSPGLAGEILDTVKEPGFMDGIAAVLSALRTPQSQPKIETPQEISETKKFLIEAIKNPSITDHYASFIYSILDRIMKGDQDFTDLVSSLLQEKQTPNNTNNG